MCWLPTNCCSFVYIYTVWIVLALNDMAVIMYHAKEDGLTNGDYLFITFEYASSKLFLL